MDAFWFKQYRLFNSAVALWINTKSLSLMLWIDVEALID
jgi:hypothetical protein